MPADVPLRLMLVRALGAGLALLVMEVLSDHWRIELFLVPFATSIVVVMATPQAPFARPWNVVVGHLVSAAAGLLVARTLGHGAMAAAIGMALAVTLMYLTRSMHPPAGIDPVILGREASLGASFLVSPVLIGALMLVAFAVLWHRLVARERWPERWWPFEGSPAHRGDSDAAGAGPAP
jgi:CBS-domain-containing membrane protein